MRAQQSSNYNVDFQGKAPNQHLIRFQNGPIMLKSEQRSVRGSLNLQINESNGEVSEKIDPLNVFFHNRNGNRSLNERQMMISGQNNFLRRAQSNMEENIRYVSNKNRDSHLPQYLQSEQECDLCRTGFDLSKNVPMMICHNQHNCCLQCAKQTLSRKTECPFCRVQISINEVKKNRIVANIIENEAKIRKKQLLVSSNPQKQLFDHINGGQFNHNLYRSSVYYTQIEGQRLGYQESSFIDIPRNNSHQQSTSENDSCFDRLRENLNDKFFLLPMFFTLLYNVPFFICEFFFVFSLQQQKCMDYQEYLNKYINGFCLRTWLTVSGLFGLSLFFVMFFGIVVCVGVFGDRYQKFVRNLAVVVSIVQGLKISLWNILGLMLSNNISIQDQFDCSGSVITYMKVLLYIEFIFGGILLSMCIGNWR